MDGELEIYTIVHLYDAIIIEVFKLNNNLELNIFKIFGDINDNNKLLLTLCLINNNHYNAVYQNNNNISKNRINIKKLEDKIKKYLEIKSDNVENINLEYSKDNRKINYKDIYNFIYKDELDLDNKYPKEIYNIEPKSKRNDKKKNLVKQLNCILLFII